MLLHLLILFQRYNKYSNNRYSRPWYEEWWIDIENGNIYTIIKTALLVWLLILIFFYRIKKEHHSNWNTLIDNFDFSSKEFYALLKKELLSNEIKGIETSFEMLSEGGYASKKRLYLRVTWKNFQYDMCAAPFGKGFFVSWWLLHSASAGQIIISKIPLVGIWLSKNLFRTTYYKIDTASMFQTYCHQSVLNVIDNITKEKGFKALSEDQRKPITNYTLKR